jgi:hypothetical protein
MHSKHSRPTAKARKPAAIEAKGGELWTGNGKV